MNFNMKKLDSITAVLLFALVLFSLMAFTTYNSNGSNTSEIPNIKIDSDTIITKVMLKVYM